uniref:Uncharacterized protein n=1 Tax=Meloidogyne hapla TaxID=6305 RepID=A0A1I8B5P4_MELHA
MMTFHPNNSSNPQQFSPPIFCIQLLFERISSPWESNFEGIKTIFVRFLPSSSSSTSLYPQRQIRVGSGHLFFIRGTAQGDGPLWLDLEARSEENQKIWKGRVSLINKDKKIFPIICPLQCQQGLALEAHFLLNINEIQKKNDKENLINKCIEKEAQTDLNNELIERGTQTNKELKTIEETSTTQEHQKAIKQRQKDKRLIKLLLILLLKAKNEKEKTSENKKLQKLSKTTNTECSLPPFSDNLFNKLIKNNKIKRGHFRAQIGYLSSVHRTIVEDKKTINPQRREKKIKKEFQIKPKTAILNFKNIQQKQKIKKEESPPSSGLQSIAFTSPEESERNFKDDIKQISINTRVAKEVFNLNNSPKAQERPSSPTSSTKISQKQGRESSRKSSTKSSPSSTRSSKNNTNSQVSNAGSIISSVKNSSSSSTTTSKSTKAQKSSESTTTEDKTSNEDENSSNDISKQTKSSTTTKTTKSSITSKKTSRSSSISGGEEKTSF